MSVPLRIPVGPAPDWETKENDNEDALNSVSESSTLYHSLRQSRNAWLTTVLPKFSSKSRAKGQRDVVPPPHNLRFIAKCDIEIGPHIFAETSVYEAHYMAEPPQYTPGVPSTYTPTTSYSQTASGSYTYPLTSFNPYVAPPVPAPPPVSPDVEMKEPEVTPALIARVNEAAATNPTLHNLLQIAAAGGASMEQLRTLGFFIQQLAVVQQQQAQSQTPPSTNLASAQSTTPQSAFMQGTITSPSSRKHDLILEFRENHAERFLVPREIVACEQEIPSSQTFRKDIVLYTFVPFLNDETKFKADANASSRTPAVIRFLNVSEAIWETIRGWVNEEAKQTDAWDSFYDKMEASGPRTYLQHRLPNGELLTQLKTLYENEYPMKLIKPTASSEMATRRIRPRKQTACAPSESKTATNMANAGTEVVPSSGTEQATPVKETIPKRRKSIPKVPSRSTSGTPNRLHFINTIAPPFHPPPQVPATVVAPAASTSPTVGRTQPSEGTV